MKQKDIIILIIPSFLLIVAWIIFNIYHSSVSSTISSAVNTQISPIVPSFDMNTVNNLKQRQSVAPLYQFQAAPSPTPFQSPVTPISSLSASQINSTASANTPQSSAGGTLVP